MRLSPGLLLLCSLSTVVPALADTPDPRLVLADAMAAEIARSAGKLKLKDFEAPYFISYRLTDVRSTNYRASYGALTASGGDRYRALAVDVRVGDYIDDNTSDDDGFYFDPRD